MNPENKDFWVEAGEYAEGIFLRKYGQQLGLTMNPFKHLVEDGKFQADLWIPSFGDLKTVREPFFTASKYGLDPNCTVTFNRKDAERYYRLYPQIKLYFWVNWDARQWNGIRVNAIDGVWSIDFPELVVMLPSFPEHHYQNREGDKRNARSSFLIDLNLLNREV